MCGIYNRSDLSTVLLEFLGMLDLIREVREDEFVHTWLPAVDDLVQHFYDLTTGHWLLMQYC